MTKDRKKITNFLSDVLVSSRLLGMGKYWSDEVSIDYGTSDVKRVDFLQFKPAGVTSIGLIEKGTFICYEVKSCIEDVYSGNGLNFFGEQNYIVTTMECYKQLLDDFRGNKFNNHMHKCFPNSSNYFGVMVAVPKYRDKHDEFENPTEIDFNSSNWEITILMSCRPGPRKRSMTELLFCMLRSGQGRSINESITDTI